MLIVSLKPESEDDTVHVETASGDVTIRIVSARNGRVRVGVSCPPDVMVCRAKVRRKINQSMLDAVRDGVE